MSLQVADPFRIALVYCGLARCTLLRVFEEKLQSALVLTLEREARLDCDGCQLTV